MTVTFRNTLCLIVVASCLVIFPCAAEKFDPKTFQTEASFDLVVSKSNYLKPGTRSIQCRNAIVSLVHGLVSGNSDGLEVMFFTRPIAEAALPDIMSNHARELMQGDYAAMVLLLDKENKVRQVNLSVVVPGTTVGRTVAWKPDELRKYFNGTCIYDFECSNVKRCFNCHFLYGFYHNCRNGFHALHE